jgi:flagellin
MVINHNISALYANRLLSIKGADIAQNMQKLSSGMRINRASDDASGLAVSEKLRAQIRGLNQAERNLQNAVSFIQTTEGYLSETHDILHRIRELGVQAANGIYTAEDRMQIQVEVSQLVDEINRIASHAQFNGMNILTGAFASPAEGGIGVRQMIFQVGANMDQSEQVHIGTMTAEALGLQGGQAAAEEVVSISSPDTANRAIGIIDTALRLVSKQRADLGAYQNRFEAAVRGIAVAAENMQAAEAGVRDVNMAQEMVEYVKNQVLMQASTAMLAQANIQPQSVLQLLG